MKIEKCDHKRFKDKGSYFKCLDCDFQIENELGFIEYMTGYGYSKEDQDKAKAEFNKKVQ